MEILSLLRLGVVSYSCRIGEKRRKGKGEEKGKRKEKRKNVIMMCRHSCSCYIPSNTSCSG